MAGLSDDDIMAMQAPVKGGGLSDDDILNMGAAPQHHGNGVPMPDATDTSQTKHVSPDQPAPKGPSAEEQGKAAGAALDRGDYSSAWQGSPGQQLLSGAWQGVKEGWGNEPIYEGKTPVDQAMEQAEEGANPILAGLHGVQVAGRTAGAAWNGVMGAAHAALVGNGMDDASAQRLLGDLQMASAAMPEASRSGAAMADPGQPQAAPKAVPSDPREAAIATPPGAADAAGDVVSQDLHPKVSAAFPEVNDEIPDLARAAVQTEASPGTNPVPEQQGAGPAGNPAAPSAGANVSAAGSGGTDPAGQGAGTPSAPTTGRVTPQQLIKDFDTVGVDPNVPTLTNSAPIKVLTNIAEKAPLSSGVITGGLDKMKQQTADAAARTAQSLGQPGTPYEVGSDIQQGVQDYVNRNVQQPVQNVANTMGAPKDPALAGETAQQAVQNFAKGAAPEGMSPDDIIRQPTRNTSFTAKAGALYDRFRSMVPADTPVDLTNTLAALKGPMDRFPSAPELGQQITSPRLQSFFKALAEKEETQPAQYSSIVGPDGKPMLMKPAQTVLSGGNLSFGELSELGSTVGRMLGDPQLLSDIPRGDLKNLYSSIMDDQRNAAAQVSLQAVQALDRARQYYSAGHDRVDQIEALTAGTPEQAIARINAASGTSGTGNMGGLRALRRSVQPDDWNQIGGAVLRKAGMPSPGEAGTTASADFSPSSFAKNYSAMSDAAKSELFGPNKANLDRVVKVINRNPDVMAIPGMRSELVASKVQSAANVGGDIDFLNSVKSYTDPAQFGRAAASRVQDLGKPTPGAQDILSGTDFSPSSFVTRYNQLSERGKQTMFGEQVPQLDALARVAQAQKNLGKLGNPSGSAIHGAQMATLGGMWAAPVSTISSLLGARAFSGLMMNPGFARWLYSSPDVAKTAVAQGVPPGPRLAVQLANIASANGNPALMSAAATISQASKTGTGP